MKSIYKGLDDFCLVLAGPLDQGRRLKTIIVTISNSLSLVYQSLLLLLL